LLVGMFQQVNTLDLVDQHNFNFQLSVQEHHRILGHFICLLTELHKTLQPMLST